jgi:hypothetical protein
MIYKGHRQRVPAGNVSAGCIVLSPMDWHATRAATIPLGAHSSVPELIPDMFLSREMIWQ